MVRTMKRCILCFCGEKQSEREREALVLRFVFVFGCVVEDVSGNVVCRECVSAEQVGDVRESGVCLLVLSMKRGC